MWCGGNAIVRFFTTRTGLPRRSRTTKAGTFIQSERGNRAKSHRFNLGMLYDQILVGNMSARNKYTPEQIRQARQVALHPLLEHMGYPMQTLQNGNWKVYDLPIDILIKETYWINPAKIR